MPIRITGINSGFDTDAMVKELVSAYTKQGEKNVKEKTKFEWKTDIWKDVNKKIKAFNTKVRSLQFTSNYSQKKTTSSDEKRVSVIAGENAVKGTQTISVNKLAKTAYVTSKDLNVLDPATNTKRAEKVTADTTLGDLGLENDGSITLTCKGKSVSITTNKDTKLSTFVDALKAQDLDLDASFDEKNGRLFISAKDSGADNNFTFSGNDAVTSLLGLTKETGASVIEGQDAEITLNGATFTSKSNEFDINGLAITVRGLTDQESQEQITLTTDTDTDTIYKNIKGLLKEYSKLINELDKLYNAGTAKGYEPLTDEEKDAMSDEEIKKWEEKIKDSLLRRDANLGSVINAMKNSSFSSYVIDDEKLTLADFGIRTLGYFASEDNERNALHISGDEDDDAVSGETNKLKQMIAADPDKVAKYFAAYMSDLADRFNKMTASSTNRSYGNFYDDKKYKSDMTKYEKKISDWDAKVKSVEDRYYKQFSEMEYQMAKLNSTQQSLSNYFGG